MISFGLRESLVSLQSMKMFLVPRFGFLLLVVSLSCSVLALPGNGPAKDPLKYILGMFSVMCNLVSWFIWEINDIAALHICYLGFVDFQ